MAPSRLTARPFRDDGYASVSAIVLCAALSLLCAGILTTVSAHKQAAQRAMVRAQQKEAMNTAVLHFAVDILHAEGSETLRTEQIVAVPGGEIKVSLRAEQEARKWPLRAAASVDEAVLKAHTSLSRDHFADLIASNSVGEQPPKDDCLRTLFSAYGVTDPGKNLPETMGVIAHAGGHDGQLWRIRAVTGGRVEERQVRFLGDANHLFAVVSLEDYALGEMPTCTQLTNTP